MCCCVVRSELRCVVVLLCSMLEDFSQEVDNTHSKLDSVMKKLAKVSHMTSGTTSTAVHPGVLPQCALLCVQ